MMPTPEIPVTLSAELLRHLRGLAAALDVPLHWLVAGLVCDTLEGLAATWPTVEPNAGSDRLRSALALNARRAATRRTAVPA